ncbi:hypothetical protein [Anaerosporobacter sp.]|uniref:hypothetical protein n=1 Tax=Anaerosporobacter sp. TaxID=1872529 RepID=UPI00286EE352|nr:hypothetical protein [Anaerosporobacter sp.]
MKIYRTIVLIMLPILVTIPTSVSNAASVSYSEEIQVSEDTETFDESNGNVTDDAFLEQTVKITVSNSKTSSLYSVSATSIVSETKYKTADLYSKATGKKIGTVTLEYKTQQISGRPCFVLADCYATMQLSGSYRGNITITRSTVDVIVLQVDYNNLLDSGYTTVQFIP